MKDFTKRWFCRVESPLGAILLSSDGQALTGLWFAGQRSTPEPGDTTAEAAALPVFQETVRWLNAYFGGREPDFTPALRLRGTPFQVAVWTLLRAIPYGQTVTYGALAAQAARQLGVSRMSAQAVGGAVGRNRIALIVPCHRVVGADGGLVGYAGGLDRKKALLALERKRRMMESAQTPIGGSPGRGTG